RRVEPEGGRDRPDMPAGVEVTPARGEIVPLDPFDDRLADARALAELGHGQPGLLSRLRHHCANAHPSSAPCPSSRLARIRGAAWTWLDYAQYREVYPEHGHSPRNSARSAGRSSGFTSTSRALEPSLGPTTPRRSSRSMSRPALANPIRSLRWSIEVEPNWLVTISSAAWHSRSRSSPMSSSISRFAVAGATTSSRYSGRICALQWATTAAISCSET